MIIIQIGMLVCFSDSMPERERERDSEREREGECKRGAHGENDKEIHEWQTSTCLKLIMI